MSTGEYFGLLVTIVVPLVGATWFLACKFSKVGEAIGRIESELVEIRSQISNLCDSVIDVWRFASLGEPLSSEKMAMNLAPVAPGARARVKGTIDDIHKKNNPLTDEQIDRVEDYWERVSGGKRLAPDEAREFKALAEHIKEDRPNDPGAMVLAALAGLALGAALGAIITAASKK